MTVWEFMANHGAAPEQIDADSSLELLLKAMENGLAGKGNIPMLPSYLPARISVPEGARCAVVDAGGTNYRSALASFERGIWEISGLSVQPMPGTREELGFDAFYEAAAAPVRKLGIYQKVGFCFSYNVTMNRDLDGTLDFWCKEVRAPDCVGKPVGSSLAAALGRECESVHVLNDSVAAMLGAENVQVGIILGTGVNVCYEERVERISKISGTLKGKTMIISTEIGEFDGFPESDFEKAVIASSDAPESARAEKQCSGGYLGDVIGNAWRAGIKEGLLPRGFQVSDWDLARISKTLAENRGELPEEALEIARTAVSRAAKIAAVLCAGPVIRAGKAHVRIAVEGSQYWKLAGFRKAFHKYLDEILAPKGIGYEIVKTENACLIGAAKAAFAEKM